MTNQEIAKSWELWCEYMDTNAEDSRERWEAMTIEERIAELELCFGKDE